MIDLVFSNLIPYKQGYGIEIEIENKKGGS